MLTFNEYKDWYVKNGKCIDQIQVPRNTLNEVQLNTKYLNYLRKEEKRLQKILDRGEDLAWEKVSKIVWERDKGCRLKPLLNYNEWGSFLSHNSYLFGEIDLAHIIPRSISKKLYYEPKNIILLDRTFHSRMDHGHHPLTGLTIDRKEMDRWWVRIIGNNLWEWLWDNK